MISPLLVGLWAGAFTMTSPPPPSVVESLRAGLEGGARAVARVDPGPLGLEVVTLAVPGAYPGTGVRCVVLFREESLGIHGKRDFAALVRTRGWMKTPPAAAELVAVFNACDREGLESVETGSPKLVVSRMDVDLSYVAVNPMNPSDKTPVRVVLSPDRRGAKVIRGAAAPATPAQPVSLSAAVASGDSMAVLQALQRLSAEEASSSVAVLASLTLSPVETLSVEALAKIPDSEASAAALQAAWAGLPEPRRKALVAIATELRGAAFGGRL